MPVFDMDNPDAERGPSRYRKVPAGWYRAVIADIEVKDWTIKDKVTKEPTGEMGWIWDVKLECAEPGVEEPFMGRKALFLRASQANMLKCLLKALGREHKGQLNVEPTDLIGDAVAVDLEETSREYQGRTFTDMEGRGFEPWRPISQLPSLQAKDKHIDRKLDQAAYERREEHRTGVPPEPAGGYQYGNKGPVVDETDIPF